MDKYWYKSLIIAGIIAIFSPVLGAVVAIGLVAIAILK